MGVYSDLEISLQEEEADRVLRRRDLRNKKRKTYKKPKQPSAAGDMFIILTTVTFALALGFVLGFGFQL